jgi:adenosine deaminase
MADHNLGQLLELGLAATVNSDDPAYFGGYMTDNFLAVHSALGLAREQYVTLAANAIAASFIDQDRKAALRAELDAYASSRV